MRKSLVLSTAIIAFVLASCSQDIEIQIKEAPAADVTVNITASGEEFTKTFIDGAAVKWNQTGEYLRVLELAAPVSGNVVVTGVKSNEGVPADGGAKMSFSATFPDKSSGYSSFNYYAVYPDASCVSYGNDATAVLNTPAAQKPSAGSFDSAADLMIARPVLGEPSQAASLNLAFTRVVAVGKMTLTKLPSDENVVEIRFSAAKNGSAVPLAGRTRFNLDTAVPVSAYGSESGETELVLDYTDLSLKANGSMDVFFTAFPFELGAGDSFTVVVVTESHTYTREVTLANGKTLELVPGKASRFTVDMSGAEASGDVDWSVVNTSNVEFAKGNAATYDATVSGYVALKVGTSSTAGSVNITVPAGTNKLHLHAAAWNGVNNLSVNITAANGVRFSPTSLSLTPDTGISGGSNNFTLAGNPADYYYSVTLAGVTQSTVITLEPATKQRFVIWGVNAESTGSGGDDPDPGTNPQTGSGGWLELPAYTVSSLTGTTSSTLTDLYYLKHSAEMGGRIQRNYTCLYDPEMYASYWVAYPLCYDHKNGTGRKDEWAFDPDVPESKQTNCTEGAYKVYLNTTNYEDNYYARGHQLANADRNGVDAMCIQTYYMTNITPQIQNGFNGGVWNNLEAAIQNLTSSIDTVYVITGAAFRKKGGNEVIKTIVNQRDKKTLPVPNYYWKALLKVKRSGGGITSASAVGFWLPHDDLKGAKYADYTVSVDQLEEWTGLDIFTNLPEALQTSAETNTNWTTFQNFK